MVWVAYREAIGHSKILGIAREGSLGPQTSRRGYLNPEGGSWCSGPLRTAISIVGTRPD